MFRDWLFRFVSLSALFYRDWLSTISHEIANVSPEVVSDHGFGKLAGFLNCRWMVANFMGVPIERLIAHDVPFLPRLLFQILF